MRSPLPIVALVLVAASIVPAAAQSTVCASLSADLAALSRRAPVYDPYGDAVVKQRVAIERANADYQRQCSTGLFSRPSPACPGLAERIQAMQVNLAKLERAAPQAAARTDDPHRQKLLTLMHRNGCDVATPGVVTTYERPQPGILTAAPDPRHPGPIDPGMAPGAAGRIFTLAGPNGPVTYREEPGGRIVALPPGITTDPLPRDRRSGVITTEPDDETMPERDRGETPDDAPSGDLAGSYRTLCVRTCDGYYFPVSYSAGRNQFSTDADVCHARCPGTETRLFVVKSPGEDGEQSFAPDTGELYSRLPNALRYRHEVVNACTCGRPDPSLMPAAALPQEDRAKDGSTRVGDVRAGLPVPNPLLARGEDPETLADLAIDFVPHPIDPVAAAASEAQSQLRGPATPKTVRVVGPKFYADR